MAFERDVWTSSYKLLAWAVLLIPCFRLLGSEQRKGSQRFSTDLASDCLATGTFCAYCVICAKPYFTHTHARANSILFHSVYYYSFCRFFLKKICKFMFIIELLFFNIICMLKATSINLCQAIAWLRIPNITIWFSFDSIFQGRGHWTRLWVHILMHQADRWVSMQRHIDTIASKMLSSA